MAAVAEDEKPPGAGPAGLCELRPAAAEERAVAVLPHLDGPALDLTARRAEDKGPFRADFRGELVGDALGKGAR